MINVLAFDLSSVCVGVVASRVNEITKTPIKVISCPVIPSKFDVTRVGYKRSKAKIKTRGGEYINSYIKEGEKEITKQEKKRRDIEVRNNSNLHALSYISTQIEKIVTMIKPNVVLVEKNKIFNGVLTSVLLGKVMGVLVGITTSKGIPLKEYEVATVRKNINIVKCIEELVSELSQEEIDKIPDITKRALRKYMEKKYGKYGLKCSTDDESDACVVFDHWLENEL